MEVVLTIVLTIGISYLLGHLDEIKFNNSTSPEGYHTDHDAVNRDLVFKGKNETMRRCNRGEYDVKDDK